MNLYITSALIIAGIALLIFEYRIQKWKNIIGGLGINIFAAGVVLLLQQLLEQDWNLFPYLLGGGLAILLMSPFLVLQQRRQVNEIKNEKLLALKDQEKLEIKIHELETEIKKEAAQATGSGILVYTRNYVEDFKRITGRDFAEYARSLITESQPGSTFKVCGIDWTELFGEAVSATSERYYRLLTDPRTTFKIMLLHPESPVGLEKRMSEARLIVNGNPRYIPNHPYRVYGKIIGSLRMIMDYHNRFVHRFQYRFLKELPTVCWVMNGQKILFYLYTRSHKGWDSPVFVAEKVPNGIYEFLDEYFDFLWENPEPVITDEKWNESKKQLDSVFLEFNHIIASGESGSLHDNCIKP